MQQHKAVWYSMCTQPISFYDKIFFYIMKALASLNSHHSFSFHFYHKAYIYSHVRSIGVRVSPIA